MKRGVVADRTKVPVATHRLGAVPEPVFLAQQKRHLMAHDQRVRKGDFLVIQQTTSSTHPTRNTAGWPRESPRIAATPRFSKRAFQPASCWGWCQASWRSCSTTFLRPGAGHEPAAARTGRSICGSGLSSPCVLWGTKRYCHAWLGLRVRWVFVQLSPKTRPSSYCQARFHATTGIAWVFSPLLGTGPVAVSLFRDKRSVARRSSWSAKVATFW